MSKDTDKVVLIVEKQPNYTQALVKQIIVAGLKPVIAVTGEGGLRKLEECRPDLILLEAELSDMDGLSFVSEVRQNREADRIPIVAMSVFPQLKNRFLDAGCNDFLQKPVRMIELMARLKKFLYSGRDPVASKEGDQELEPAALHKSEPQRYGEAKPTPQREIGSVDELLVLSLASAEGLAKLLAEKGIITEKEYRDKITQERQRYQQIHQRITENRLKST